MYSISGATRACVPITPNTPLARAIAASSSASARPLPKRPFAIDVFTRFDRRPNDLQMVGHLDRERSRCRSQGAETISATCFAYTFGRPIAAAAAWELSRLVFATPTISNLSGSARSAGI